ncbi:MAG: hypothetical protein B6I35_13500 [Anaerolineaceae bacterium 4572_32.2]|nr:MAG: hypothetical protein B6I35_13500 [Anaerolineaceae bacterium 4572_32.2]
MELETALSQVLACPTPEGLWQLRADLLPLADNLPAGQRKDAVRSLEIAREFHGYLAELRSKMTAREYSQLASRMDVGSVGMLALQDLLTEREHLLKSLFMGGLSEGLMVLATLQYVKAWEAELALTHDQALWWLFEELWRLSGEFRPQMAAGERRKLIDALLAPARSEETEPALKVALLLHLFQVLLLGSLGWVALAWERMSDG